MKSRSREIIEEELRQISPAFEVNGASPKCKICFKNEGAKEEH